MKKVLAIVLTLTMILCALPTMALGNTPVISLELKNPAETISKGDEITVAVKLDEVPGDLFAFDLRIDYPASVLSVTSVAPTAKNGYQGMNLAQSGKIEFSYALKTGSFTTELAIIKFKVLAEIPATIKINEATVLSPKYSADAQDYSYTANSLKVDIGTASNPSTGTPAPTPDVQYADIQDHWAKDYILTLIDKGVISGYEDGTVRPDNLINRQEATKIIVSAIGKAAGDGANLSFTDADAIDAWAKGWVQTAVDEKIMNGYDDGSFRPAQSVSRAELAVIAMRAFGFGEDSAELTFTDKDAIPDWAKGFIAKASSMSIINGYEDGSFQPENFVTRAEACAIIAKCLEK